MPIADKAILVTGANRGIGQALVKDENGNIFHTHSAYARGTETTMNTYNYLDLVPKGRDEDALPFTMSWLRHHDRYADSYLADPDKPYWPADAVSAS
jgi:predicted dithiol-disulfide oxidoreductase (DUF899 family)